ncbi:MAG: carboxypeptidase-like regulatory domain-containing protein [Gemmatimonadales bacterium]|nr:carboxypeptidase-like regulatory domain-containing protein [Gemmatimonadales bacterium]
MSGARGPGAWGVALLLGVARPAAAQVVQGVLVDSLYPEALTGALVTAERDGVRVATGLAEQGGRFTLVVGAEAPVLLRVARIGFAPDSFPGVVPDPVPPAVPPRYILRGSPTNLPELVSEAGMRCPRPPFEGPLADRLISEVRLAVEALEVTRRLPPFAARTLTWERLLDRDGATVVSQRQASHEGIGRETFINLSPDTLARTGFIVPHGDTLTYHVPDARMVTSAAFLAGHCTTPVPGPPGEPGLIGLRFEPAADAPKHGDVTGTLWVELATRELRRVEFSYVRLPPCGADASARGEVRYRRLPDGRWVIERWFVRMPVCGVQQNYFLNPSELARTGTIRGASFGARVVRRLKEDGGQLAELGDLRLGQMLGRVRVALADSARAALTPLANALVTVRGTEVSARTDSLGRAELGGLLPGRYTLEADHPRIRALQGAAVRLAAEADTLAGGEAAWAVPPAASLLPLLCKPGPKTEGRPATALHGHLSDAAGHTLEGATLEASWREGFSSQGAALRYTQKTARATTDRTGLFTICGIPPGVPVAVLVTHGTDTAELTVTLAVDEPVELLPLRFRPLR